MLPAEKKQAIEKTLAQAEQASEFARLKIVQELGGQLCWCSGTAKVMWEEYRGPPHTRDFRCSECLHERRVQMEGPKRAR